MKTVTNKMVVTFTLIFVSALSACSQKSNDVKITTGSYDDVVIVGYDSASKMLSGYLSASEGDLQNPSISKFSCRIEFRGKVQNQNLVTIEFYEPGHDSILAKGSLKFEKGHSLNIKSDSPISFCQTIFDLGGKNGELFNLKNKVPIKYCSHITAERSYLSKQPSDASRTKSYLIKNDLVSILKEKDGWAFVEYYGSKVVSGWIKSSSISSIVK